MTAIGGDGGLPTADLARVKQPAVSRMERRVDMYLSTLQTIVKAMGGELEIIARFPEGSVKINQLRGLEKNT